MHFYSAFAHVQFVGDDLVRLALMDRADNGDFAAGDDAGRYGARRREGKRDPGEEAFRWDVRPARQNKANRFDRDLKSHRCWDITLCPAANHGPHDLEIMPGRKNDGWYNPRQIGNNIQCFGAFMRVRFVQKDD